jgi:phosphatidylserine decarboxylase
LLTTKILNHVGVLNSSGQDSRLRLASEGLTFIAVPLLLGIVAIALGLWPIGLVLLGLAAFMAYFFRDPEREIPSETDVVVSPADGRVTRVEKLDPQSGSSPTLISIFLSPFDVHINRSPIEGEITDVTFTRGKFLMATNEKASLLNEQNAITIKGVHATVVCKQIAGILARRIVCWKKQNEHLSVGERFGLIKFSSRTDLILPSNVEVFIQKGMRVKGGTTIVGRIRH